MGGGLSAQVQPPGIAGLHIHIYRAVRQRGQAGQQQRAKGNKRENGSNHMSFHGLKRFLSFLPAGSAKASARQKDYSIENAQNQYDLVSNKQDLHILQFYQFFMNRETNAFCRSSNIIYPPGVFPARGLLYDGTRTKYDETGTKKETIHYQRNGRFRF